MRFTFKLDPKAPLADLLPSPAKAWTRSPIPFNEDLTKAGVLVTSEGLLPEGKKARVAVSGGKRVVTDGPYTEAKELIGEFYVIEVGSLDEAIGWAMRCPVGMESADVLEIRQLTGAGDIPDHYLALAKKVAPTWIASIVAPRPKP